MKILLPLLVSLFGYHYEMSTDPNNSDTELSQHVFYSLK